MHHARIQKDTFDARLRRALDAASKAWELPPQPGHGVNEFARRLSAELGKVVQSGYVSRIVRGERGMPRPETVRAMAKVLGADYLWLMHGDGTMRPAPASGGRKKQ